MIHLEQMFDDNVRGQAVRAKEDQPVLCVSTYRYELKLSNPADMALLFANVPFKSKLM